MINDQCDVVDCTKRATIECEQLENREPIGNYVYVCKSCYEKDKDNLEIVRTKPNEFETHIYDEKKFVREYKK